MSDKLNNYADLQLKAVSSTEFLQILNNQPFSFNSSSSVLDIVNCEQTDSSWSFNSIGMDTGSNIMKFTMNQNNNNFVPTSKKFTSLDWSSLVITVLLGDPNVRSYMQIKMALLDLFYSPDFITPFSNMPESLLKLIYQDFNSIYELKGDSTFYKTEELSNAINSISIVTHVNDLLYPLTRFQTDITYLRRVFYLNRKKLIYLPELLNSNPVIISLQISMQISTHAETKLIELVKNSKPLLYDQVIFILYRRKSTTQILQNSELIVRLNVTTSSFRSSLMNSFLPDINVTNDAISGFSDK